MSEQYYKIASDHYASDSDPVTMAEFEEMCTELGWEIPEMREVDGDYYVGNECILEATKTALDAFGLRVVLINPGNERSLVGDGDSTFWVDTCSLNEQVRKYAMYSREEEEIYSEWCCKANASQEV
jgi:hypothetical protein